MADKRISDLSSASSLTLADLLVLVNDAQTKKTTIADLLELIANQNQFAELDTEGKIPAALLPDTVFGAVTYQASWNANTNTPAIPTAAAENKGWYYVVSTAGTTNVGGISDWQVGDWLVSNGTAWQKVDNTDAVSSWNGRTGAVVPASGDYTTSDVTEGSNKYYTAARVLAEVLVGLTVQNSAITNADSILTALGKAQGQIDQRATLVSGKIPLSQIPDSLIGAANYQSTWNASTNSPTIPTAATGNKGWYYVVSTAGSTNVGGITDWKIGDWVISNGTAWQKVDNTDAISSFNSRTGAIIPQIGDYTTSIVAEEANMYYTGNRVRAEVLTGLSTATTTAITASDSVLSAFGKAQGQLDLKELASNKGATNGYASLVSGKVPAAQLPSTSSITEGTNLYYTGNRVRAEVLTGLSTTTTTAITATDTVLSAFGKVQGQLNLKGAASGYASLDTSALVPRNQLPKGQVSLALDFTSSSLTLPGSTTTETLLFSKQIPANTLASGDQLNLTAWIGASNGATNPKVFNIYFNTSNAVGGTLVGCYKTSSANNSLRLSREFSFISGTTMKAGVAGSTFSLDGQNTGALDTTITIPSVSSGFWVVISGSRPVANTETVKLERVALTAFLQ